MASAAEMKPRPAHLTKNEPSLSYPLPSGPLVTIQQDDGNTTDPSTGRTVWLGAQVLAVYLHDLLKQDKPYITFQGVHRRKRVVELGAGTGLLSLSLHHSGMDVVATDIPSIATGLLHTNLASPANRSAALDAPVLQARALDWLIDPSGWDWTQSSVTPPLLLPTSSSEPALVPPFDLICTTDSVYSPNLSQPLLRALHALSTPPHASASKPPPIWLALEARDPDVIAEFLRSAKEDWKFKCAKTDGGRLEKLVGEGGLGWELEDWEGVQVWKLQLDRRR